METKEKEVVTSRSAEADQPKKVKRSRTRKAPVKRATRKIVDEFWMMVADFIVWLRLVLGVFTEHAVALAAIIIFHETF